MDGYITLKKQKKDSMWIKGCPICKTKIKMMTLVPDNVLKWFGNNPAVCWKCYLQIYKEIF